MFLLYTSDHVELAIKALGEGHPIVEAIRHGDDWGAISCMIEEEITSRYLETLRSDKMFASTEAHYKHLNLLNLQHALAKYAMQRGRISKDEAEYIMRDTTLVADRTGFWWAHKVGSKKH